MNDKRKTETKAKADVAVKNATNTATIFDKAAVMERLMDDKELVKEIIGVFLNDIPKQIKALKDDLDAGDTAATKRQAHSIKGASANLGGDAMSEVALEMEKAARSEDLNATKALMPELKTHFKRLKEAMEDFTNKT